MAIFGQYLLDRKADIERDATREIPRQPDIAGIWPALASATRHGRLQAVFANRTNEKLLMKPRLVGPARDDLKGSAMAQKSTTDNDAATEAVTPEERKVLASKLVDRFSLWSGAAGLIPVPVVDVIAVGGVQLQMLNKLSQLYGVPFAENRGKALIASLAGSWIPATSGIGAASALKVVPLLGTLIGGFVMPALSAGATYAIGKAFIQHFESGGTLLDFNPPDYREFVKAQKDKWDARRKGGADTTKEAAASS